MHDQKPIESWLLTKNQTLEILESKPQGLTPGEVVVRQKKWGKNLFSNHQATNPVSVFIEQFLSPLIWILIAAGVVTWYLGEYIETVVIFGAVLINVCFAFYQEYQAETTIDQLMSFIKNRATVLRDGVLHDIDAEELVPGDIVSISYGNRVPADGRLIDVTGLKVDESILTGESIPVTKQIEEITSSVVAERTNSVFCGTYVPEGVALFVVTATGAGTEIGKIAESVSAAKRVKTPVQNAVRQISWYIFGIAIIIVGIIMVLGVMRGESFLEMLVLSAAVAVGAVPEALPITLTVILSVGVFAISKRGGLIRKLAAAETLGSTTLILTDKTGTLTQAELSLLDIVSTDHLISSGEVKDRVATTLNTTQKKLLEDVLYNIQATVEKVGEDASQFVYSGGEFDRILLKSLYQFVGEPNSSQNQKLILPFNSVNKYSIAAHSDKMVVLGAPDVLLEASTLDDGARTVILDNIKKLGEEGKRIIAVGYQSLSKEVVLKSLDFKGIFVFSDPIREEAPRAIADIQSKGIQVKIITGDMLGTALAIARQVGIEAQESETLSGEQIRELDNEALKKLLPSIKLFVRVTPEDKMRIGMLYQELGEVVAMTGDGVNDAPALKAMDIGISLGSASDVAKSAADMILLDNNFKTITETITEGYKIRSNIQKTFVYLMSTSLDEVFVIVGALIAGIALPLSALQIIWVNILTGTLPALSFAYDEHHATKSDRASGIFNARVKFLSFGIGVLSSVLLFGLYYSLVALIPDVLVARSVFFVCFATYALSVSYSFKNIEKTIIHYNPFTNARLNIANIIGMGLIIATVMIPALQNIFHVIAIPVGYLWIIFGWNILNILIIELSKLLFITIEKKMLLKKTS